MTKEQEDAMLDNPKPSKGYLPSVRELSDEELNVIVAECCGWRHEASDNYNAFFNPNGRFAGGATHNLKMAIENAGIPNYSQSLDAMAMAEATIVDLLEISNYEYLVRTAISNDLEEYVHPLQLRDMRLIQCTARQRSEAFAICRGVAKP